MNINPNYDYKVTVLNCVDGDSFDVEVDLGFLITMKQRVHVWGMTSRELHSTDTTEKAAGLADRNFEKLRLSTIKSGTGSFVGLSSGATSIGASGFTNRAPKT